jgi:hypothetical protein
MRRFNYFSSDKQDILERLLTKCSNIDDPKEVDRIMDDLIAVHKSHLDYLKERYKNTFQWVDDFLEWNRYFIMRDDFYLSLCKTVQDLKKKDKLDEKFKNSYGFSEDRNYLRYTSKNGIRATFSTAPSGDEMETDNGAVKLLPTYMFIVDAKHMSSNKLRMTPDTYYEIRNAVKEYLRVNREDHDSVILKLDRASKKIITSCGVNLKQEGDDSE